MAFVKIEDKTAECELIVFPGVYEKLNAVWEQDKVIIAKGKVSYKDRDGNLGQELKIMADQANIVTEEDAKAYQPKGKKPKPPKGSKPTPKNPTQPPVDSSIDKPIQKQTLFVQIKDPADHDRLLKLRELASSYSGDQSVVLVLGDEDSKTAMRMPFKVTIGEELTSKLHEFFEEKCIAIRASA